MVRVGVGTLQQTKIPPAELPRYGDERLSGLRCIGTKLKSAPPSTADLSAMAMQRLDAFVALTLNKSGYVDRGYVAHLVPNTAAEHESTTWTVLPPQSLDAISKQDFLELVFNLEAEFSREFTAQAVEIEQDLAIIVGLISDRHKNRHQNRHQNRQKGKHKYADRSNHSDRADRSDRQEPIDPHTSLLEMQQLVESAGGQVLDLIAQKRDRPHPQTVIGQGKVEEIALAAQAQRANLIVFNQELSPAQTRNLERLLGIRVSDRTEVILDIFAQRAQSAAGKLQVELAQLEYRLPRLSGRGQALSRLGGGIGTRGPGETKLESDRRTIQKRISHLQRQVNQLQAQRDRMRQRRVKQEIPTVAIVGYTNAGKSTLLNSLTKSTAYAADQLFATLDPTTRRLNIAGHEPILLTDTVGFIHELPPPLVDAFRATLEEVTEADALLHVVDASHPAWLDQVRSVNQILAEMPIAVGPVLLAFNKCDRMEDFGAIQDFIRTENVNAVLISATKRKGFEDLQQGLIKLVSYAVGKF
nr:GTPase HflX [Pseudanabaena sp. PCC 7367]